MDNNEIPGTPNESLPETDASPVGTPDPVQSTSEPVVETHEMDAVADSATEDPSETPFVLEPRKPSETAQQDFEVTAPLAAPYDANKDLLLSIPPETAEVIDNVLSSMPNLDIGQTQAGEEWKMALDAATYSIPFKDYFNTTLNRAGAKYRQTVQSERGLLAADSPKFNDNTASQTGERAVLRIRSLLGMGSVVRIPLWHSGFWISLKAPREGDLLELNRLLAEEKITLGRSTWGLAFANNSVMYNGWLMDFAMRHVYDSSLKAELQGDMRSHISSLDIPLIVWGLACVIWPGGFPYARAVLDQTKKANKVVKEMLKISKLLFVDNASLSPWQISHMANRNSNTMTLDSIKRYRDEFVRGKGRVVQLTDKVSITLRNPSIDEYLTSGQKWVNNIVNMVDRALGMAPDGQTRDQYILDQGKASNMRQYAHFVESIDGDGQVSTDVDTIEEILDVMSSDDSLREAYFKGVRSFIEDATVAVVAIPVTEDGETSPLPRFPHLLAIDPTSVFFILLVQKIPHIQAR